MSMETSQHSPAQPLDSYTYVQDTTNPNSPKTVLRSSDNRVYTIATNKLPTCLHTIAGEFSVIKAEVNSSTIRTATEPTKTAKVYVPPFIQTIVSLKSENEISQNIGIG